MASPADSEEQRNSTEAFSSTRSPDTECQDPAATSFPLDAEFSLGNAPSVSWANFLADWRAAEGQADRNRVVRLHLDHFLHTRRFQIAIIVLVLLDAIIVVAELAIDLGLLSSSGREGLESSAWPHVLHSLSLTILSLFLLEAMLKLYAMGWKIFQHKMELFDMFVIVVSFGLDVASAVPGSQLTALFGLVVLLRLWRIVRIVNSIALSIRLQGKKALVRQSELREAAESRCQELNNRIAELKAGLSDALDLLQSVGKDPSIASGLVDAKKLQQLQELLDLTAPDAETEVLGRNDCE
uniref:Voltage-gated hydrogen channel 1 n=1 Tax=Macrostomum lignano TaxID=282301 RepID=A0A1I8J3W9_9PLAT